jgi:hypothetical protein
VTFAAPLALLGLAAAAIPVLLHLVQKREPPQRDFPAMRYLEDATRDHRRRLRLRHLLLLAIRTALVIALVLAAAGPVADRAVPLGTHAPTATVVVVDNSASSSAVVDGEATLDGLLAAARAVFGQATPADRLWLVLADGVARSGTAAELLARLDLVVSEANRFDLGEAVGQARLLLAGSDRPGEVIVVTDAQRSAIGPNTGSIPITVLRPSTPAPGNRAIDRLDPGPQPWGPDGGRVALVLASPDSAPVAVTLTVEGQPARDLLVATGMPVSERVRAAGSGWRLLRASLPPDEMRLDDSRETAIRVAMPAGVTWNPDDRFLAAGFGVLAAEGRVRIGGAVRVGALGPGASVVLPPEDPALVGALNRALEARGIPWRYRATESSPGRTDSTALLPERIRVSRRTILESAGREGDVLVTVDGAPWLVRSGEVVLVGSRFDPAWTELPTRAAFVPLLDALVTRIVEGQPPLPEAVVGVPIALPERVGAIAAGGAASQPVEGGAQWTPVAPGVVWLLSGPDTVGAVAVTIDPRESALVRAEDAQLRAAWPGARVHDLGDAAAIAFGAGGRGDLRPLLLGLALVLVLAETVVAGRRPAR